MSENSDADHTFVRRMEQLVEMVGGRAQLAAKSGLSRSVIDKYLQGASEPSRPRLVALANAGPVSVAWLATGEGSASKPGGKEGLRPSVELDKWLFSRIIAGIRRTYKKTGAHLPPENEVELGLEIYYRISAFAKSQDEKRGALLMALDQLERDLVEKAARPASGKRSA